MTNLRSFPLTVLASAMFCAAVLCGSTALPAQNAVPAVRIVTPIDEGQLVTLKGNIHPAATADNDRGPVSPGLQMAGLTLVLSRSPEQQEAFDAFVAGQYQAGSPNFHQWLTPAEIGTRFGPAQADIATISGWLSSHGFAVNKISPDHMTISFSGTASQVEAAFHTQIHNLSVNGVPHIANMTNPQLPAAIAPVVFGIKGLHNFLPHPLHKVGSVVQFNTEVGKWQRTDAVAGPSAAAGVKPALATSQPHPLFGIGTPGNPNQNTLPYLEEDIAPADFATIYNLPSGWPASNNGSGQTIAIAGTSDITLSDVTAFRSAFGLPAGVAPVEVKGANGIDPGICTSSTNICSSSDLLENSLDVEWSGAVAAGAQIVLVTSGYNSQTAPTNDPIYESAQYVVDNHADPNYPQVSAASILSVSYGQCELFSGTSTNVAYNNLWQTAAAEGISVFVATGDSGSPSCDQGEDGSYGNPYSAQFGINVSGLASTPYNTAVGGTDFSWCKPVYNQGGTAINGCPSATSAPGPYWKTSNDSTTGESAAGYVPETPWNDTCLNPIQAAYLESIAPLVSLPTPSNPEAACNWVQNNWYAINTNYQADLSYFVDTVGGSGGASNCVANNGDTSSTPTCTSGATSTGVTTNPTTGSSQASLNLYNNGWPKPSWQAGVTPSDGVRDLPDVSFFAGDGSLDSATLVCDSLYLGTSCSTSNVPTTMVELGGTSVATPEMAGVMALINQKEGAAQGLATPGLYTIATKQTYASCSAEGPPSANCYFHSIDEGTNAMPCDLGATEGYPGAPGIDSPNCVALNSGDTVGTLVSSGSTPAYNATMGFNLATGLGSLNVANVLNAWTSDAGTNTATMNVTLNPSTGSLPSGAALTVSVTITGGSAGTPTGYVTVSGGGYGQTVQLLASGAVPPITVPPSSLAPGPQVLTITYSGDNKYASTSQSESLSVAPDSPTVTVSAPAAQNILNSLTVTVAVTGPVGAPLPTGNLSLAQTGGSYISPGIALNSSGTATFTIPANTLTVGSDTLTATYVGVSPYSSGTGTTTVTIVNTPLVTPIVTVTPGAISDTGQPLPVTVLISGSAGTPTGTVSISVGSYSSSTVTLDNTGTANFGGANAIPGNTLSAGNNKISASYSGDANYLSSTSGSASITIAQSTYALAATKPAAVSPGTSATSTITATSSTYYTGTVTFSTCTLASSSVTNGNSPPSCSASGKITFSNGTASGSGTATVITTAASAAELVYPNLGHGRGRGRELLGAGGSAVLAFIVFLGIPARRRAWRAMLGLLLLIAALGTLSACGGGGSGGNGGTATLPTTPGTYTFTVSGTSNPSVSATASTTFVVTVN